MLFDGAAVLFLPVLLSLLQQVLPVEQRVQLALEEPLVVAVAVHVVVLDRDLHAHVNYL